MNTEQCLTIQIKKSKKTFWAQPGFEPGTTRTQTEYHTPRPLSLAFRNVENVPN